MAILNTRSPKWLSIDDVNISYAVLKLYVWDGVDTAKPATPIYTIRKSVLAGSEYIYFEIAELVRDELDVIFDGNYNGQAAWVSADISAYNESGVELTDDSFSFIAFDGYDYFEELSSDTSSLRITNRELFVLKDNTFRVPIYTNTSPSIVFYSNGVVVGGETFTNDPSSENQVKYSAYLGVVDKIEVLSGTETETIKVNVLEECKYEPKKVTFINKFGILQDVYFFKKAVENMTVEKESYKSNILDASMQYSRSSHVNRDFNVIGKESTTLSSGFLSEEYNEVFKQMMLSEKVWVTNVKNGVEQVLPINVSTSDITYKTSLNNKLVEYTIEFDNSYDTINNIR